MPKHFLSGILLPLGIGLAIGSTLAFIDCGETWSALSVLIGLGIFAIGIWRRKRELNRDYDWRLW